MRRSWATALLALLIAAPSLGRPHQRIGGDVQERANAVLSLMAFSVVPDLTASFLSINSSATNITARWSRA